MFCQRNDLIPFVEAFDKYKLWITSVKNDKKHFLEEQNYDYIIVLLVSSVFVCYLGTQKTKESFTIGSIVGGTIGGLAFLGFMAFLAYFFLQRKKNRQVQKRLRSSVILRDLDQQTLNKRTIRGIENVQRNIFVPLEHVLQQSLVELDSDGPTYQEVPENGKV